jgi:hypothetical protein
VKKSATTTTTTTTTTTINPEGKWHTKHLHLAESKPDCLVERLLNDEASK